MNLKKYNVYDTQEEEYTMKDATMEELQIRFRCGEKKLRQYVYAGYKLDNRYIIRNTNAIPTDPNRGLEMSEAWIKGWNDACTAAKLLKTGHGKMVVRNGRKCVVMK